jgi:hypothetical protein
VETAPVPQAGGRFGFPLTWFMGIILGAVLILAFVFLFRIKQLQNFPNRTFVRAAGKEPKKSPVSGKANAAPDEPVSQTSNPLASNETARRQSIPNKTGGASPDKQTNIPAGTVPRPENTASLQSALVPHAPSSNDTVKKTGSLLEKAGVIRNQAVLPVIPPVQQAAILMPRQETTAPPRSAPTPQTSAIQYTAKNPINLLEKIGMFRKKAVLPDKQAAIPAKNVIHSENTAPPLPALAPLALGVRNTVKNPVSRPVNHSAPRKLPAANSASSKKNPQIDNGPLLLSLFVEDQNTNIGRRNVHSLKAGYSLTIGGGKSDFLIFLVSMPPRIAELHYDGAQCTLIPRRPDFFPDLGSEPFPDCIEKPIRLISERNYELIIRIDRYEDPLITLNRLLHSVDVPGHYWPTG